MNKYEKRPYKGNSLIQFPTEYVVIDIETTGVSPRWDEIIEIAALKICDNEICASFESLVKPPFKIPSFVTELTGISNDMVADSPCINEILPSFFDFIGDSIILGHNVHFDINFIYDKGLEANLTPVSNNFIDTLRLSRKLYPELSHHRLADMVDFFRIDTSTYHRALADCESTFKCFKAIKQDALLKYENEENFANIFKRKSSTHYYVDVKKFSAETTEFDISHPLYNKTCVFTGALEHYTRAQAMQIVVNLGGIVANSVTSKTNYLILGNNDYCATIKDGKSTKQKKAEKLLLEGKDILILPETVFYDMIEQD